MVLGVGRGRRGVEMLGWFQDYGMEGVGRCVPCNIFPKDFVVPFHLRACTLRYIPPTLVAATVPIGMDFDPSIDPFFQQHNMDRL